VAALKVFFKQLKKLNDYLARNKILLLILAIVILLRIPTLFEPNRYADEDIYLTLGQAVRKGLVFYRDIHDNKPPLLYLTAAAAYGVFGFRLILLFWNLANVFFFWLLAEKVLVKRILVILSTFFFAILSTIPRFEGNIANGEIFMIMPATLAMLLLWLALEKPKKSQGWLIFAAVGFLFAIAFLFKTPIAFDLVAAFLFLLFFANPKQSFLTSFSQVFSKKFWALFLSFSIPIFATIVFYTIKGAGTVYLRSALMQNIGYLSSWGDKAGSSLFTNPLVTRALLVFLLVVILYLARKRLSFNLAFVSLWFLFALYGALLSSRPYPHYLLQLLPPFTLLFFLILTKKTLWEYLIIITLFGLTIFYYFKINFWYYKSLPYYQNFLKFAVGAESQRDYFSFFGEVNRNYQIAQYIVERTTSDDQIFVWGTEPAIYALANRLPVGRYTVEYHIIDFNAFDETIAAFEKHPPKIVVAFPKSARSFPKLDKILVENYVLVGQIKDASIYLRLPLSLRH